MSTVFAMTKDSSAKEDALPIIASDMLFDAVTRFNLFPAEYADSSWLTALDVMLDPLGMSDMSVHDQDIQARGVGTKAAARTSPVWLRGMSSSLLNQWELDRQYDFDYSDTGKRIALLSVRNLQHVGQHTAALLSRTALQRLIRGDDVTAVDAVIGRDLRMSTLAQQIDIEHAAPDLAEVRAQAEAAIRDVSIWSRLPMQIALSVLPENAAGARARLRFKFPYPLRRMAKFRLSEVQRRQLVEVCLVAAKGLNDPVVDNIFTLQESHVGGPL